MEPREGKKETVYTFFATVVSKVFTYILLIVLANLFVKEVYGRAAFVMSVFDLTVFIGSIGVPHILSPWIARKKEIHSIFYSLMGLSFIFMIAGLLVAIKYPWVLPIVLVYPLIFLRNIMGSYLQADFRYHISQFASAFYILVALVFVFIFKAKLHPGIILAYAIGYLANSLVIIWFTRKELRMLLSRFMINLSNLKEYLRKSFIISILYISFLFLKWIDTAILGLLSTFSSVAAYNVAAPITNAVSVISVPLSFYLLSRAPKVLDDQHSTSILKSVLRISLSLTLVSLVAINALSHLIISIFFPQYIGVEIFIMLLSIGLLFFSMYSPIYYYTAGKLQPEIGFSSIVTAAVVNVALDIILIPYFDIYGIVIATTIAHITAFIMLFRRLGILKEFVPSFLTIVFLVAGYYLGYLGLVLIPFSVIALYLLKLFRKSDYMVMKNTILSIARFK